LPDTFVVEDEIAIRKTIRETERSKKSVGARAPDVTLPNKLSMKPNCESEKKKPAEIRANRAVQSPNRPNGPRDTDQYNFTDPDSRIMKNSTNDGFDQHYNRSGS